MLLSRIIQQAVEQSVIRVMECLGAEIPEGLTVAVEQPANPEHGDYSSNIAMQLARTLRKPPLVIAQLIREELEASGLAEGLLEKANTAAPGFLNVHIRWSAWAGHQFELPPAPGEKVIIEHTSVNPNKSMHIGHLRNSCIGDTLVRMLRRIGYTVEVHNYIDDLGNQLADTVVGLLNVPLSGEHVRFGDYCWDIYSAVNREYTVNPELAAKRAETLHELEEGTGNVAWLGSLTAERIVREHVEEMRPFGIEYDLLVWESSIVREGFWSAAFERLRETPYFYREMEGKLAGCWVLKQGTEPGVQDAEHTSDKVLVRSNGILTYTAKDIAYHLWKFGLLDKDFTYKKFTEGLYTTVQGGDHLPLGRADIVINVIDSRQEYPQTMVKEALRALGYSAQSDKLHHAGYGVVSLSPASAADLGIDISDGKASYAMSGRQGIGIKVSDLIYLMEDSIERTRADQSGLPSRDIAIAAIRYYLLRFNLGTEVVFDLRQATEISGNTGVYLMYSYARAVSVLAKAADITPEMAAEACACIPDPMEKAEAALLRHIAFWPDTLDAAVRELAPNAVCGYAHTLATLFNNFYSACPILKAEPKRLRFRLWLARKFADTLKDALDVLGLPAPDRL
ncbi:arginine--tRNA ligase [Paenibacillus sabinae]|uniref:Arginine--tRNA ligase n=1 Tax=Paenibacillus sabinae T27 TaxID=1268072 RepID=X4ZN13_9BACL|nr:arginine--tRNA ligase [Paenibacillus sabinae]AHV98622.1 arginyl-tRNA synthetase [Paenibacillus sabinae T27]